MVLLNFFILGGEDEQPQGVNPATEDVPIEDRP